MPFGLLNVGDTFQRAMEYEFKELIGKFIEIYQDDLIIFSKEKTSHISHIKEVFEICGRYGILFNPTKFVFRVE